MGQICNKEERHQDQEFDNQSIFSRQCPVIRSVLSCGSITLGSQPIVGDSDQIFRLMSVGNEKSDFLWQNAMNSVQSEPLQGSQASSSDENAHYRKYRVQSDMRVTSMEQSLLVEQLREQRFHFVFTNEDAQVLRLFQKDQQKFRQLVVLGPPQQFRWCCWKTMLLYDNEKFCRPQLYENMIERLSDDLNQIRKDMDRTLCSHPLFEQAKVDCQIGQNQLMRVLNGVANALPELGYCQGMNFLCGIMLIVSSCDESMCFSAFMSLLLSPRHMLYYLYCPNMPFHNLMAYIILKRVKQHFPILYKNVKRQQIPDSFWISKMVLSLFLYIMDLNNCVRAWDYIIARGAVRAVPEIIVSIIQRLAPELQDAGIEEYASVFQGFVLSNEKTQKTQHTFDKAFKIGNVIYDASFTYRITRVDISNLATKFIKKNKDDKYSDFYKLFANYDNFKKYEEETQSYIAKHIKTRF